MGICCTRILFCVVALFHLFLRSFAWPLSNCCALFTLQDIFKQATEDRLTSAKELPYFEGDFWPNVLEESIKELEQEEEERKKEESTAASETTEVKPLRPTIPPSWKAGAPDVCAEGRILAGWRVNLCCRVHRVWPFCVVVFSYITSPCHYAQ